ncbi:hypothetical protein AUEXF2481DRAFT_90708 [Aureobasidium subglaciale EXF-2481]|uniref:Uncharacterized protein n=1 Tax=Aureobasidium subglaciale (strain EXF-2481) TaxID=1043005 RepID=A0A074Y5T1_AURSE|nr:uncharacterized protein AUEXF2481DRAFT_90708 [Aureobasidium subglaciale EXF-2481]KAI5206921.1 hypothetical protein E4T38_03637 [Aureobasidium subglaciale]KAI5225611.1 hypothetical protein E4T40_03412 [Aureobasidium subglaciale]KAI5229151.1 hypothetical protein E4T41_03524 [Aureobasidium subglaciale]KAI5263960.1 hypothetical protein E4T46_03411 [Aureobasidium subglaciale]KEQ93075.1 hypothetical protein AUEXF2481DRAFT_90708 [Aureobasidium subglaciale EXF-2481]
MASWDTDDQSRPRYDDYNNKARHSRNDSTLDPTYHDPTRLSSYPNIPIRSHSRASRSRNHSRVPRRWPPPPSVEDEEASMRREHKPERANYDRIPSRGTVGQEPLLIDVPGYTQDRRFVWVPSTQKSPRAPSTPPSSDDERARHREKRKGPRIETNGLPEMRREASPYAWTKPTPASQTQRTSEGLFLSPDTITPPAAPNSTTFDRPPPTSVPRNDWSDRSRRSGSCSTRDKSPPRSPSRHVYEGRSTAEDTRSADDHIPYRPSTRYSWTKPDPPHSSPTTPFNQPADGPRRQSGPTEGNPAAYDYSRKPAPPQVVNLQQSGRPAYHPRHSSEGSYNSYDNTTQVRNTGSDKVKDSHPPSIPSSRPTSRGGSTQSSPQPSPRLVTSPEYPWNMGSAASTTTRRAPPPSRLAETTISKSPRPQASRSVSSPYSPLPYPDDDRPFETMPSEKDHQYFPEQPKSYLAPVSEPVTRVNTPKEPPQVSRVRAAEEKSAAPGSSRREKSKSEDLSSKARKSTSMEHLPACKRARYMLKYDDWYTLEGYPGFNICPRCFKYAFDRTQFGTAFRLLPKDAPANPRRCEFSNAWIRLAWLLTANNRQNTLNVMKTIFKADETEEPCPGIERGWCSWYSIRDRDGQFLRDFVVCPSDVKRVETLFSWIRGLFVLLPSRFTYDEDEDIFGRFCSLRPENNNRFAGYIDCLFQLHENAVSSQRLPSTSDFVSLVGHKTMLPECLRDDKVEKGDWYYVPSLAPALTVCDECYNDVVLPWVRANSDVAMRFNRAKQSVRNEGKNGLSCQLYSRRMREAFRYAVDKNDMRYLARKAKDRKEVEEGFQRRCKDLQKEGESLKGRSGYAISSRAEQELAQLQREIEAIGETWEQEWE